MAKTRTPGITVLADGRRFIDKRYPNGDTLAGRPIVSDPPSGTFLLVAAAFLNYARDDAVSIATSSAGTIEMDSVPSGDITVPTAMSHSVISLFSSDSAAVKATLDVSWRCLDPLTRMATSRFVN